MLKPDVLRGAQNFSLVYNRGKSIGGKYVVVFYKRNGLAFSRRGFLASKKVGNAVKRNRARRLMKEAYRTGFGIQLKSGYDYIFIARNTIEGAKMQEVSRTLYGTLRKADLITRTK
ncbi:MAG: ribonuclease P protein component [Clostridiales Family XIII bacterium]|jgi:ribonuclease P protein component|nr:ribonuclease P protein component [Clostridiales Family XIII bacterium]